MKHDTSVLAAMAAAVEQSPPAAALALRLHLATLLLENDDFEGCLTQCQAVLALDATNAEATSLQAKAHLGIEQRKPPPGREAPVRLELIRGEKKVDAPRSDAESDDEVERPTLRLSDVGGLERVKRRLNTAFLGPMKNPELLRAFGKSLRGGLLLFGPPGCGKTFIARAVAGELGALFISVGLHDVLNIWLGESERRLHAIFERAAQGSGGALLRRGRRHRAQAQ